jgi:hypothetical protein
MKLHIIQFSPGSFKIALMKEAVSTSETSPNFQQTVQRNMSEDIQLHIHRCNNQKSHVKNKNILRIARVKCDEFQKYDVLTGSLLHEYVSYIRCC